MNDRNDGCKYERLNELKRKSIKNQNSIRSWTKAKITKHLLTKNKFEKGNSNKTCLCRQCRVYNQRVSGFSSDEKKNVELF